MTQVVADKIVAIAAPVVSDLASAVVVERVGTIRRVRGAVRDRLSVPMIPLKALT